MKRPAGRRLDLQSQLVAQVVLQPDQVQQRRPWGELDEEIEIDGGAVRRSTLSARS